MLAQLLFDIIVKAVLRVAEKCFFADAVIVNNMTQLQRKEEKGMNTGTSPTGKVDARRRKEQEDVEMLLGMLIRALYRDQ